MLGRWIFLGAPFLLHESTRVREYKSISISSKIRSNILLFNFCFFYWICDIEILRLHYAETLKAWRERFMARREEAVRLYDERFARMWEFYLASSEMSFRKQNLMNFQIQLTKRQGVVPMTRDYIGREEAKLRGIERGKRPRLQIAGG